MIARPADSPPCANLAPVIDRLTDMWADSKLGVDLGVRHHDAWVRSAIVTDIPWMARATRLFLWMIPGEARVFPLAELEQAKAWVAGAAN